MEQGTFDQKVFYEAFGIFDNQSIEKSLVSENPLVRGDILINLSNWIGGYRVDRFYEAVPYIGFGIMHACRAAANNVFKANAGLINQMRLSDAFDLNIEIRGSVFEKKFACLLYTSNSQE